MLHILPPESATVQMFQVLIYTVWLYSELCIKKKEKEEEEEEMNNVENYVYLYQPCNLCVF